MRITEGETYCAGDGTFKRASNIDQDESMQIPGVRINAWMGTRDAQTNGNKKDGSKLTRVARGAEVKIKTSNGKRRRKNFTRTCETFLLNGRIIIPDLDARAKGIITVWNLSSSS